MPRKKAKDALDHLGPAEGIQVLRELLGRHKALRGEANQIAESLIDDVSVEAGMKPAAEKICQGIVIGLHEVDGTGSDGALGWAPDFPPEAAAWSLSILLELYPQSQRRAAGNRVIGAVEEKADSWVEMLERVVSRSTTNKQRKRR